MNSNKVTILLVFTTLLIFSAVSRVFFNDFQDGWVAYEKKDYKTAYELWLPLAEQGDPKAQFFLGFMHDMGFGVPEDNEGAVKWYELAAEQGDSRAQLFAGFMYDSGRGVPKDDEKAVKWYQLASEQGFKRAKINIYKLAKKNSAEALEVLLNDAKNGSSEAQLILSAMSEVKLVVSEEDQQALKRDRFSEEQEYVKVGKLMLHLVSQNDPENAKKIILDGYNGMNKAQNSLGLIYSKSQGARKDQNKVLKWYKPAQYRAQINKYNLAKKKNSVQALEELVDDAEKGVVEAKFILATMYADGRGVLQDNKKAFRLFYRVAKEKGADLEEKKVDKFTHKNIPQELKFLTNDAENGIEFAQYKLGMLYAHGQVLLKDNEQAVKWYRLAAEQGNSEAQYALGVMYVKGLGVLASENEAIKWFRFYLGQTTIKLGQTNIQEQHTIYSLAKRNVIAALKILADDARNGMATAQYYLGDLYRDGIGVSRNSVLAYVWYNLSALQGNENSADQIIVLENKMSRKQIQQAQTMMKNWISRKSILYEPF